MVEIEIAKRPKPRLKTIKINEFLYEKISIYAECCAPQQTIDKTAEELIEIGTNATSLHLAVDQFLKKNPNTQ
jgi:hypothetical protein